MTTIKLLVAVVLAVLLTVVSAAGQFLATDPGVRGGAAGAGGPLKDLTPSQLALFDAGSEEFQEADGLGEGLGPRFNLDSCAGCHTQPAVGGTSPATNPQIAAATPFGARNVGPSFLTSN